ncbi:MAG: hypothetical protein NVS3B5_14300 [Sphingomicrobium sp.]
MMPPFVECLGYVAASLTTVSFVPQAWHTLRTRDVSGISLAMYASFTLGIALWLAYGIVASDKPIIVANAVTLVFSGGILFIKVREDARKVGRGSGESLLQSRVPPPMGPSAVDSTTRCP